jgi:hypothetical protein
MRKSLALIAVALAAIVLIASKASAMPITKAGANELCQGHHMLGGLEANSKYFGCSWCYKTASGQTQCQYVGCDEDSCDWIVFREKTRTRFGILTPPSGYLRAERRSDRELAPVLLRQLRQNELHLPAALPDSRWMSGTS